MILRALEPADAELMYKAENDMTAVPHSDSTAPLSMELLRDYAENYDADPFRAGQLRLVAAHDDSTPFGLIDFYNISSRDSHAMIAIYILPSFRGKSLAKAMLNEGIRFADVRLGLRSLIALVHTDNMISSSVFEASGFLKCGTLKNWHFSMGKLKDVFIFQYSR